jgi:hypothetical protein
MDTLLILIAFVLLVVSIFRGRLSGEYSIDAGLVAGGLAAALVAFVVLRHTLHPLIVHDGQHHHTWFNHGFFPGFITLLAAVAIGSLVWLFDRNRYRVV